MYFLCRLVNNAIACCVFFLSASLCCAKNNRTCEYVYQYCSYGDISLMGVSRSDTATILTFQATGVPGEHWKIPQNLYLDDENHRRYYSKSVSGATYGDNRIPVSGKKEFSVIFEPLPAVVSVFDLRTITYQYLTRWAIWGIHQNGRKGMKFKTDKRHEEYVISNPGHPGDVTITGELEGDTVNGKFKHVRLQYLRSSLTYSSSNNPDTVIDSKGRFLMHTYVEGPGLANVILDDRIKVPLFLIPGDTIRLSLYSSAKESLDSVTYKSEQGHDLMVNLLNADPRLEYWGLQKDIDRPLRLDTLYQRTERYRTQMNSLHRYLAWKHQLTAKESHLLKLQLNEYIDFYSIRQLNAAFNNLYSFSEKVNLSAENIEKILATPEYASAYSFLRKINTKDCSYFMLPDKVILMHGHGLPFATRHVNDDDKTAAPAIYLEKYMGQQLDEEWRKRMWKQ